MSWGDVILSELSTETVVLPEGPKFVFELMACARFNKFDEGKVDAGAKVAEGEYKGTPIYFSYPDPQKQPWSAGVFARMIGALRDKEGNSIPAETGEDPVTYLNRAAKLGGRFAAPVRHRAIKDDGIDAIKAEVKIGNVSVAK